MKPVILAVLVLLVVTQSEGLRCYCGGQKICPDPTEVCSSSTNVCGSIFITAGSRATYSKGCVKARDCAILNHPGISSCFSCGFDLCNR